MASIKAGLTALNTSPGTQPFSAGTATPKLGLHEVSSALTAGTVADHYRWGFGVTDGTTQRAMAVVAEDGILANSDGEGRYDDATCLQLTLAANNGLDAEAAHDSFGAGSHTLNITDAPAAANLNLFRLIGGTDVSVAVVDFTGNATANSNASVTSLSFAPNLAIVFGRGNAAFAADTTWSPLSMTLGYAVKTSSGTIEQFCYSDNVADRANPTNGRSTFRTNRCAQRLTTAADQGALELTSWLSNGATFTTRDASDACSVVIAFVRLPSRRLRAIVPSLVTSSTGNKTISGVGFQPYGYFAIGSAITTADAGTSDAERSKWSHGIVDDAAAFTGCTGLQSEDNVATSDSRSVASSTQFVRVLDDAGADEWSASHVSFDADGVTINIDDASPTTDRKVGFVFWSADETTLVATETEEISDACVLAGAAVVVATDTEEISDAAVLSGAALVIANETEEISDAAVLSGAAVVVATDTEEISDAVVFVEVAANDEFLVCDETEEISDACVLVTPHVVCDETEQISDECILIVHKIVCDETEEIGDHCQLVGAATLVIDETEEITDQALLVTGAVMVCDEEEQITDGCVFVERRLRAGGWRGTALQGGAVAGDVLSAGSARGKAFG